MQMQKHTKPIKQIIGFIAIIILLLLLIFAEDIIKLTNKNKILENNIELAKANYTTTIAEFDYPIDDAVTDSPNSPIISAGMIPVKWDGANWVITTAEDENWYDYSIGKPAYVMLNDGTYQSELIRNMTGKKLAKDNINVPIQTSELGTICLWCPRFAYNNAGEILYIKQCYKVVGTWQVPEIFTYVTAKMDFSLAGVWIENKDVVFQETRVSEMNNEEGKYGFIANTKASAIQENDRIELQQYITYIRNQKNNETSNNEQISDININLERAIIKITNAKKREAIKANAKYQNEKIIVTVEYSENGISEIIDVVNKQRLELKEGSLVADTGNTPIGNSIYDFVVIDKKGNHKKVEVTVSGLDIYIIKDKPTLYAFRDAVNAGLTSATTKAYQVADVTVPTSDQWTPIADYATKSKLTYAGTYDGGGHTVSGININTTKANRVGFFGTVSGKVYNLGIINSTIKQTHSGNATNTNNVGGLIATLENGGKVDKCYSATIINTSVNYCGGIIGYADTTSAVSITNCYNAGTISCTYGSTSCAGGLIGHKEGTGSLTITNSYNTGTISAAGYYVGGIVGDTENCTITISNCYNTGKINGKDATAGILGIVRSTAVATIKNCYNTGTITGSGSTGKAGTTGVGGIVGCAYANAHNTATITYCYNSGTIIRETGGNTGGIIGQDGTISYCYNTGAVNGKTYVGGISGHIYNSLTIKNTYNIGNVTGEKYVGGICGYGTNGSNGAYTVIEYSYNLGTIGSSTESIYVGGISGQSYSSSKVIGKTIVCCTNTGKVYGKSDTNRGALVGYHSSESYTPLSNCNYLEGTATYATGRKITCTTFTSANIPTVISRVGVGTDAYKTDTSINADYPVLKWQTINDRLNLINSDNAFKQAEDGSIILSWQN